MVVLSWSFWDFCIHKLQSILKKNRRRVGYSVKYVKAWNHTNKGRGVLRTLSNIKGGAFYESSLRLKAANYFCNNLYFRCLTGFWIRLWKEQRMYFEILLSLFQTKFIYENSSRSFSDPYFPAFEPNTEIYGVSLRIQSECGKVRTRKNQNTDTFYNLGQNIWRLFHFLAQFFFTASET